VMTTKKLLYSAIVAAQALWLLCALTMAWMNDVGNAEFNMQAQGDILNRSVSWIAETGFGTSGEINIADYIQEHVDAMNLSPCSSYDGKAFFFPRGAGKGYRPGTTDDQNVNYISLDFTLKAKHKTKFWFDAPSNGKALASIIGVDNEPNNFLTEALRMSVTVYDESSSEISHTVMKPGSAVTDIPAVERIEPENLAAGTPTLRTNTKLKTFAEMTYINGGDNTNNVIIPMEKNGTARIAVRFWIENEALTALAQSQSPEAASTAGTRLDLNMKLTTSWVKTIEVTFIDHMVRGYENMPSAQRWVGGSTVSLYAGIDQNAGLSETERRDPELYKAFTKKLGVDYTWTVTVPVEVADNMQVDRYGSGSDAEILAGKTMDNFFAASNRLGKTTLIGVMHCYAVWSDADAQQAPADCDYIDLYFTVDNGGLTGSKNTGDNNWSYGEIASFQRYYGLSGGDPGGGSSPAGGHYKNNEDSIAPWCSDGEHTTKLTGKYFTVTQVAEDVPQYIKDQAAQGELKYPIQKVLINVKGNPYDSRDPFHYIMCIPKWVINGKVTFAAHTTNQNSNTPNKTFEWNSAFDRVEAAGKPNLDVLLLDGYIPENEGGTGATVTSSMNWARFNETKSIRFTGGYGTQSNWGDPPGSTWYGAMFAAVSRLGVDDAGIWDNAVVMTAQDDRNYPNDDYYVAQEVPFGITYKKSDGTVWKTSGDSSPTTGANIAFRRYAYNPRTDNLDMWNWWHNNHNRASGGDSSNLSNDYDPGNNSSSNYHFHITSTTNGYWGSTTSAIVTYKANYDSNGVNNNGGETIPETHYTGETYAVRHNPFPPPNADYEFQGWSTAYNGAVSTNTYVPGKLTTASTVTLYAVWKAVTKYTVTFNSMGGSSVEPIGEILTGTPITTETPGTLWATLKANPPTRSGFTFDDWYKGGINEVTEEFEYGLLFNENEPITGNITLYAKWLTNYTITYNVNAGSGGPASPVSYAEGRIYPIPEPTPNRDGYRFDCWSSQSQGLSDSSYKHNADGNPLKPSFTMPSNNVTLYAEWVEVWNVTKTGANCTLTRVGTGIVDYGDTYSGTLTAPEGYDLPATITVTVGGAPRTLVSAPASGNNDYSYSIATVAGVPTGTVIVPNVTGHVVVSGTGTIKQCTITFQNEAGQSNGTATVNYGFAAGNLPPTVTPPSVGGIVFGGYWTEQYGTTSQGTDLGAQYQYYDSTGNRTTYGAAVTVTAPMTLYARWTKTIALNNNGGSGSMNPLLCVYGVTTFIPTNTFTAPSGHVTANGWTTTQGGTTVTHAEGAGITLTPTIPSFTTLYAVWKAQVTITITAGTGGTVSGTSFSGTPLSRTVNPGEQVSFSASPSSGYIFDGWYISGVKQTTSPLNSAAVNNYTVNDTVTMEARFRQTKLVRIFMSRNVSATAARDMNLSSNTHNLFVMGDNITEVQAARQGRAASSGASFHWTATIPMDATNVRVQQRNPSGTVQYTWIASAALGGNEAIVLNGTNVATLHTITNTYTITLMDEIDYRNNCHVVITDTNSPEVMHATTGTTDVTNYNPYRCRMSYTLYSLSNVTNSGTAITIRRYNTAYTASGNGGLETTGWNPIPTTRTQAYVYVYSWNSPYVSWSANQSW